MPILNQTEFEYVAEFKKAIEEDVIKTLARYPSPKVGERKERHHDLHIIMSRTRGEGWRDYWETVRWINLYKGDQVYDIKTDLIYTDEKGALQYLEFTYTTAFVTEPF